MSSLAISRIKGQIPRAGAVEFSVNNFVEPPLSKPIEHDALKKLLLDLMGPAEVVQLPTMPSERLFNHIWDFVDWYVPNRQGFTDGQKQALDTLVQARDMVNAGCNCKRAHREKAASDYFKTFWTNNQTNDLLPTILKLTESQKVLFGDWLMYPL